ncbi:MAG: hypothetical protein FRX49_05899 [Trebouxia sp. A1-2]|nr:MAG: hypothetical protein FRX49_05899 [Trebouxia sp. A1-2]
MAHLLVQLLLASEVALFLAVLGVPPLHDSSHLLKALLGSQVGAHIQPQGSHHGITHLSPVHTHAQSGTADSCWINPQLLPLLVAPELHTPKGYTPLSSSCCIAVTQHVPPLDHQQIIINIIIINIVVIIIIRAADMAAAPPVIWSQSSQVAYLLDLLASILEEPELGGRGQAHGECILSSWQLLNIKDGMVWLQEDRAQAALAVLGLGFRS